MSFNVTLGVLKTVLGVDASPLNKGLKEGEQRLRTFGTNAAHSMGAAASSVLSLKTALLGLVGVVGVTSLARDFIETAAAAEKMRMSLDTITKGKGAETFEELDKWAAKLPVNTMKAVDTYRMLIAMGLKPSIDQMTILVDTMSAIGGDSGSLQGIARALGQIHTKGTMSAEELMQLAERGVPAYQILQQELGLTAAQVKNIGDSGITAEKGLAALFEGMQKRFGGAAAGMQQTWSGLMEQMADKWEHFKRWTMESGIFQVLKEGLEEMGALDDNKIRHWAKITADFVIDRFRDMAKGVELFLKAVNVAHGSFLVLQKEYYQIRMANLQTGYDRVQNNIEETESRQGTWKAWLHYEGGEEGQNKLAEMYARRADILKQLVEFGAALGEIESSLQGKADEFLAIDQKFEALQKRIESARLKPYFNISRTFEAETAKTNNISQYLDPFHLPPGFSSLPAKDRKEMEGGWAERELADQERQADLVRMNQKRNDQLSALDRERQIAQQLANAEAMAEAMDRNAKIVAMEMEHQEILRRKHATWAQSLGDGFQEYAEKAKDTWASIKDVGVDVFRGLEDALSQFVVNGKASFEDLLKTIEVDMMRILVRTQITGSLSNFFGGLFGAGGKTPAAPEVSGVPYHGGGVVGMGGARRMVPAFSFIGAPRMHGGGIAGNEVPAILRKGEGVFTEGQMSNMGRVSVTVVNTTGQPSRVEETQRGGGEREIKVWVGTAGAEDVYTRGPLAKAMESTYGLRRGGGF